MKFVAFTAKTPDADGGPRLGLADPAKGIVRDLGDLAPGGLPELIARWAELGPVLCDTPPGAPEHDLDTVTLHAPVPRPVRNIFCVGKNYREHAAEFGRSGYDTPSRSEEIPDRPIFFSKATTSVTGPYDTIDSHVALTSEVDYEGELGVIIGRGGRGITGETAHDHIWGYVILDDVTARDLQRDHKQWLLGKSLDTHCPMGPYAVTADEVPDVTALEIETRVNGELRQHARVEDLIFTVPDLIATLSAGITLCPGDIIATGTPVGVGIGFDPPRFLRSGDVVEVSITGLGAQRNVVR